MRQAVIVTPERFEVRTAARPVLRDPGDVIIRTAACGICSGDLMSWYLAKKLGTVLGHEMVGWAEDVGPAVTGIEPGDLLFVHHHAPCMNCEHCAGGPTSIAAPGAAARSSRAAWPSGCASRPRTSAATPSWSTTCPWNKRCSSNHWGAVSRPCAGSRVACRFRRACRCHWLRHHGAAQHRDRTRPGCP